MTQPDHHTPTGGTGSPDHRAASPAAGGNGAAKVASNGAGKARPASFAPVSPRPELKGSPIPPGVGHGLLAYAHLRVALWDRALRNVESVQTAELLRIVRHAAGTDFGREHGFASVRGYEDFKRRVPIGDYDSFSPAIERMRRGERNLLVPEPVRYFGNSSGSSVRGKSKFLPISERQIRHQTGSGLDGLLRYLAHTGDADFLRGFVMGLFPPITMRPEGPVLITSNPALMAVKKPRVSKLFWLPQDRECLEQSDYDKKLERIAELYLDHDVRTVAGTTCWFSLLFDKLLAVAARRGRSARTVAQIWPNLRVLLGGGVAAGPYLGVLHERVGRDDLTLVDTYNATEGGVYAATDYAADALKAPRQGMLMIPDRGVFFELIPAEEHDSDSPRRIPLWEAEPFRVYAIAVTTPSGLYAYKLGDLVRFTSKDPLRIEFVGRLTGCLSTTQELTTHAEIEQAVASALARHRGTAVDFAAGADVGVAGSARSRYVLFVEFTPGGAPADQQGFAAAFDEGMCQANRVYREHRSKDAAILPPEVLFLPPGSVRRFLGEARSGNVQSKFPRIVDDEHKGLLRSYATGPQAVPSVAVAP
jgi:hypothetical protein